MTSRPESDYSKPVVVLDPDDGAPLIIMRPNRIPTGPRAADAPSDEPPIEAARAARR